MGCRPHGPCGHHVLLLAVQSTAFQGARSLSDNCCCLVRAEEEENVPQRTKDRKARLQMSESAPCLLQQDCAMTEGCSPSSRVLMGFLKTACLRFGAEQLSATSASAGAHRNHIHSCTGVHAVVPPAALWSWWGLRNTDALGVEGIWLNVNC